MKKSIKQQIESLIFDNKSHIIDFGGNVKEYLQEDFANQDQGHCFYLTDAEIEEYENSEQKRNEHINDIQDLFDEYDYQVSDSE